MCYCNFDSWTPLKHTIAACLNKNNGKIWHDLRNGEKNYIKQLYAKAPITLAL